MRLVVLLLAFSGSALAQPCTTSWAAPASGDWSDPANWTANVPGPADDACITLPGSYTVAAPAIAVRSLTLGGASGLQVLESGAGLAVATSGTIGANGFLRWSGGFVEGGALVNSGTIEIQTAGGVEHGVRGTATLRNEGLVLFSAPLFYLEDGGRFENAGDVIGARGFVMPRGSVGTLALEPGSSWTGDTSVRGVKMENEGSWTVPAPFDLQFRDADAHSHRNASFVVETGASVLFVTGTPSIEGTLTATGGGRIETITDLTMAGAAVTIQTEGGFEWSQGTFTGTDLTLRGPVEISGNRESIVGAGLTVRTEGTVDWTRASGVEIQTGGEVLNTGDWRVLNGGDLLSTGGGRFVNEGSYRLLGGADGRVQPGVTFINRGTLGAEAGSLRFPGGLAHEDGTLSGTAEVAFPGGAGVTPFTGDVAPGSSASPTAVLAWDGDFAPHLGSVLRIDIAGLTPGAGHDQLAVTGAAQLAGELEVTLDGYTLAPGEEVTLITAASVSGTFDFLKIPGGTALVVTPTAVLLRGEQPPTPPKKLEVVATPRDAPLVFAQGKGGRFMYDVEVTNHDEVAVTVDLWADAVLGTQTHGPLSRRSLLVGPGETESVRYRQTVPAKAPAGAYTFRVHVGAFPIVEATDTFALTITAGAAPAESDPAAWAKTGDDRPLALGPPAPNPVRGRSTVSLSVPDGEEYTFVLFDAMGRQVAELARGVGPAADVRLEADTLAPGVYLARLATASGTRTTRLVVAR